jgi:uncharacterized protein YndB with AHSA1/START domain
MVDSVGRRPARASPNDKTRKLVYTWAWESTPERESLVTVEFKPSGEGTKFLLTHQRFADTEARDRYQHGWNGCLERLGRYVLH